MNLYQDIRDTVMDCCLKEVLDDLIEELDLSESELARLIGVSLGRVRSWRRGGQPKVGPEIYRCAMFFKVPVSYLLYGVWDEAYQKRKSVNSEKGFKAFEHDRIKGKK